MATTISALNNGQVKTNPYVGQVVDIPPSFSGVDYYDVAVPYTLTNSQLGGYCITQLQDTETGQWYQPMSDTRKALTVIDYVNIQNFDGYPTSLKEYDHFHVYYTPKGIVPKITDTETNCYLFQKNGVDFYQSAVTPFFLKRRVYTNADPNDGFYPFSSGAKPNANTAVETGNRGQLFDVILVDGTCIHFVLVDVMSPKDGNGGAPYKYPPNGHPSPDVEFATLNYNQYLNIESCIGGSSLELRGYIPNSTDYANYPNIKFANKYNLGLYSSAGTNKIAFYRMYNAKIQDGTFTVNSNAAASGYSVNNKSYKINLDSTTPPTPPPEPQDKTVKIYYNSAWIDAVPYIFRNGEWKKAEPYVFKNGIWQ